MIGLDRTGDVVRLTLDRPAQRNALATAHWHQLAKTIAGVPVDAAVVLLRSSSAGIFSAGADLAELAGLADAPPARTAFRQAMRAGIEALAALTMPVVAWIDGGCFGAGVALALAADLRIASEAARFAIPPARLGIAYPAEDVARLTARVGAGAAARLLFTGNTIEAAEALRIGLVDAVGDGAAEATAIAGNDAAALATLKAMLRDPAAPGHAQAFEDSFASARFRAATARWR